jgi:hypothetical protein
VVLFFARSLALIWSAAAYLFVIHNLCVYMKMKILFFGKFDNPYELEQKIESELNGMRLV